MSDEYSPQNEMEGENQKPKIKRPPIRFKDTQKVLSAISDKLNAPVLAYWNNPRGSVCHTDVLALYNMMERMGAGERIYVFIKSDGGNGQASLRMISLLRDYFKEVVALVPLECASAATMLALGANEIHMGPMAYLTSVDTSLTHDLSPLDRDNDRVSVSLDELNRVIKLWQAEKDVSETNPYKSLFEYVHPLVIGAVDRAKSLSVMICEEILGSHLKDRAKVKDIAEKLNTSYPSHSYPILRKEAERIGLHVKSMSKDLLELLLELNHLYSEMGQKSTTDFDEIRSHTNEILNIWETTGFMILYEMDKDWFYREEERRWIALNDDSSWHKVTTLDGNIKKDRLHLY